MKNRLLILCVLTALCVLLSGCAALAAMGLMGASAMTAKVEVSEDVSAYSDFFGDGAREEYRGLLGMDQSIFPAAIDKTTDVREFKMVYYNPWDAQYLCYLTVQYTPETCKTELERLTSCPHTAYQGIYSVTGFAGEGEPLAMSADEYHGFVYAIRTPGRENSVTYVLIAFCNYFMDLDYREYIPVAYLPEGFDAAEGNPYQRSHAPSGL